MYPDHPKSAADLVPLPYCDGPKLKAFDFQGPQKIEFLDYLGAGVHAHVFKVKIMEKIYALKVFRWVTDQDWMGTDHVDPNDIVAMSTVYNYAEPFNCECRAFGRLQETGREDLAVRCFGYVLMDEEHERIMRDQFRHLRLHYEGTMYYHPDNERSRFVAEGGRLPPFRCIVKEFGTAAENLGTRDMRRILKVVIQMQQLGICHIDVADRQLIGGKHCDFSTAITVPHFLTNPELNPRLTPEWISAMEFETFQFSINDFWNFDEMVRVWNDEHPSQKNEISVWAFPEGRGCKTKYNLRSTESRERVYSLVDPRRYNWKAPDAGVINRATPELRRNKVLGRRVTGSRRGRSTGRPRLEAKPSRWYLNCSKEVAAELKSTTWFCTSLEWEFKDGLIFPRKREDL